MSGDYKLVRIPPDAHKDAKAAAVKAGLSLQEWLGLALKVAAKLERAGKLRKGVR